MDNSNELIANKVMELLMHDNSTNYSFKEIKEGYNYSTILDKCFKDKEQAEMCGTSGHNMAMQFMNGVTKYIVPFLENVSFNGVRSAPLIMRAINFHLKHKVKI